MTRPPSALFREFPALNAFLLSWYLALSQGHNPHHQLETIVSVLGAPSEDDMSFVTHPAARKAILSRSSSKPKDLKSYFPSDASPVALDLLRRMVSSHLLASQYVLMTGVAAGGFSKSVMDHLSTLRVPRGV